MDYILNWADLGWILVAFVLLPKHQSFKAMLFILCCVLTLRLQVELMLEIGHPQGMLPFLDYPQLLRGYAVYGAFIFVFLLLSKFSKDVSTYVYIAAAITMYIVAFCTSSVVMLL